MFHSEVRLPPCLLLSVHRLTTLAATGHYCGEPTRRPDGTINGYNQMSDQTARYCAFKSAELWATELGAVKSDDPVNMMTNQSTLLLSTAHARKLQGLLSDAEIARLQADGIDTASQQYEGGSMFPAMPLGPLLEAVQEFTGVFTMVQTTVLDITMHVVYTIMSELAVLIWNLIQTLARAVASVAMALFGGGGGVVKTLLKAGLDLLMTMVIYVAIPLLMAILDLFLCLINFLQPGTWPEQLKCVETVCFKEDGDVGAEIFTTFSSIPIVAKAVVVAVEALINPSTGRKYGEAAEGGSEVPDMGSDAEPDAAASTCASCFTCRVPEVRALWLLVAMTVGCVKDEQRFAGRVEDHCLDEGAYYLEACGPREGISQYMSTSQWANTYIKHRQFDTGRTQHFAGLFEQLAEDEGGAANAYGYKRIADAWFQRIIVKGQEQDQAAPFYRAVCKQMRIDFPIFDAGPSFSNYSEGSGPYLSALFLYEAYAACTLHQPCKLHPFDIARSLWLPVHRCKHDEGFKLCSNPSAMDIVSGWHEVKSCMFDLPKCRREREVCQGTCGGNVSHQPQDFITMAAKTEISARVLGTERLARGRADCNTRNHTFEVDLFAGIGEAWIRYASRLRVRGGFLGTNALR